MACPRKDDEQYKALYDHLSDQGYSHTEADHATHLVWFRNGDSFDGVTPDTVMRHLTGKAPAAAPVEPPADATGRIDVPMAGKGKVHGQPEAVGEEAAHEERAARLKKLGAYKQAGAVRLSGPGLPHNPTILEDLTGEALYHIRKGVRSVKDFAKELGVTITPVVRDAWFAARRHWNTIAHGTPDQHGFNDMGKVGESLHVTATDARYAARKQAAGAVKAVDSVFKMLAPASRGEAASLTAELTRPRLAEKARATDQAWDQLKGFMRTISKLTAEKRLRMADAYEHGTSLGSPELDAIAAKCRTMTDDTRDDIISMGKGKLEHFIDNYMKHAWIHPEGKDVTDYMRSLATRRPLEGNKNFLKHRSIDTLADGIRWRAYDDTGAMVSSHATEEDAIAAAGEKGFVGKPLTPVTTNFVELTMLAQEEMQKYIMGQHLIDDYKKNGLILYVRDGAGGGAPEGWGKVDDKFSTIYGPRTPEGQIIRGHYYMPQEAADLLNNHLAPGLQGQWWYQSLKVPNNVLQQVQLAGFYHLGTTSLNSVISSAALSVKRGEAMTQALTRGLRATVQGNIDEAIFQYGQAAVHGKQGAYSLLKGASGLSVIANLRRGSMIDKAYLHPETASARDRFMAELLVQGGARRGLANVYHNNSVDAFYKALDTKNYLKTAGLAPFALLQTVSKVTMEYAVPWMKLGAASDTANYELDRYTDRTGETATPEDLRRELQTAWQSVDNRFGQMTHDNLFWNRNLRDMLQIATRSVGWNAGSVMEGGGALIDTAGNLGKLVTGKLGESDFITHRMAYTVALPAVMALYGAVYMYIHTGHGPETLEEYFLPKNGKLNPDGTDQRVSLPSYMKDEYAIAHALETGNDSKIANAGQTLSNLGQIAGNKSSPLFTAIIDMVMNQDYYGTQIRNEDSSDVQQMKDFAKFALKQLVPFAAQAEGKLAEAGASPASRVSAAFGIVPAPASVYQTPAMRTASRYMGLSQAKGAEDFENSQAAGKLKQQLRSYVRANNQQAFEDLAATIRAEHSASMAESITKSAKLSPLTAIVNRLKTPAQMLHVYGQASSTERTAIPNAHVQGAESMKDVVIRRMAAKLKPAVDEYGHPNYDDDGKPIDEADGQKQFTAAIPLMKRVGIYSAVRAAADRAAAGYTFRATLKLAGVRMPNLDPGKKYRKKTYW